MKRIQIPTLPILLLLVASGFPVWADLQSDLEDYRSQKTALESEIKKLDQRISQTDSLTKEETKRLALLQQRYAEDLNRRKAELDTIQSKMTVVAGDLQKERARQGAFQISIENTKAYRTTLAESMASICAKLESQVARSLPWERENRIERINALRRDLETGTASTEEAFGRLTALLNEEIRFGDEIVLINKPLVRKNGETINARLLRIGNQWMVYQDEEGNRFGVLQRQRNADGVTEFTWNEELGFEERQAVKLAIDVKMARKPPQMVSLPLTLGLENQQ